MLEVPTTNATNNDDALNQPRGQTSSVVISANSTSMDMLPSQMPMNITVETAFNRTASQTNDPHAETPLKPILKSGSSTHNLAAETPPKGTYLSPTLSHDNIDSRVTRNALSETSAPVASPSPLSGSSTSSISSDSRNALRGIVNHRSTDFRPRDPLSTAEPPSYLSGHINRDGRVISAEGIAPDPQYAYVQNIHQASQNQDERMTTTQEALSVAVNSDSLLDRSFPTTISDNPEQRETDHSSYD